MDNFLSFLVFVAVTVPAGLLCHYYIHFYFIASIAAALLAALIFQVVFYIDSGQVRSEFYPIELITSGGMAFIVALLVGIPFMRKRKRVSG
jgi:hypothetical protein